MNVLLFLLNGIIRYYLVIFVEVDLEFVRKMVESFYVDDMILGDGIIDGVFDLYSKVKVRMVNGGF